jgi:hypothetical protein
MLPKRAFVQVTHGDRTPDEVWASSANDGPEFFGEVGELERFGFVRAVVREELFKADLFREGSIEHRRQRRTGSHCEAWLRCRQVPSR